MKSFSSATVRVLSADMFRRIRQLDAPCANNMLVHDQRPPAHSSPRLLRRRCLEPRNREEPPLAAKEASSGYECSRPVAPHWDAAIEQLRPERWAFPGDERYRVAPSPLDQTHNFSSSTQIPLMPS